MTTQQKQPLQLVKTTAFTFRVVNGQQNIMDTTTVNPTTNTTTLLATCTCRTGLDS